jgi:hypothetical protein
MAAGPGKQRLLMMSTNEESEGPIVRNGHAFRLSATSRKSAIKALCGFADRVGER